MVNIEINDRCGYTNKCGCSCILNQLGSGRREELNSTSYYEFCREMAANGETIENVALVGKEPTETPERLDRTLEILNGASVDTRPLNIGMITAGHRLSNVQSILRENPLDWMAVSIDTPETGLRNEGQVTRSFREAVSSREYGGTKLLGVNTVMHPANLVGLVKIGERILSEPAIDQWALSPMFLREGNAMKSIIPLSQLRELLTRLISHFGNSPKPILVNVDFEDLVGLIGGGEFLTDPLDFWRVEHQVKDTAVTLVTMNPSPGYFTRLKYSGGILSRKEFRRGDFDGSSYGNYAPGKLSQALEKMAYERKVNIPLASAL